MFFFGLKSVSCVTVLSVPAAAQFSAVAVAVYSVVPSVFSWSTMGIDDQDDLDGSNK